MARIASTPARERAQVRSSPYERAAVNTTAAIRKRLKTGAKTVLVDTDGQVLELTDADLVAAGQSWTLRIVGQSQVRIHLQKPLPRTAQLVATDASFVEVTGHVAVHAYTRATVHAFDHCVVYARNRVTVLACDQASVNAQDEAEVFAYDKARVRAKGHSVAVCAGIGELFLEDQASGIVSSGVAVGGPSQGNASPFPTEDVIQ
ncbi:hypothetical protein [Tomitella biformata]|uniref:hypothetical protein n=1 Tax=Tomitella biformata TaxID=630403 RepID=UPI000688A0DA|nr:hypothetical protein [Tomitella biformata]